MAYFRCTEIGNTTPSPKTPCIVSSGSQLLTIPTIDGHQPYIIDTKIRLPGASPSTVNSYFLGNGHDTSYGGGWYLKFTNGSYNSSGGWIRLYDSHNTMIGDINPPQDIWFDVLCGPKRTKFYNINTSYDTMPGDESIKDYKLSLFGITQFPTTNLASIALARTKITLDDVLVADLVPINEFYNKYKLMDNTPLNTVYGWNAYPTGNRVDYAPQILTHVRIVLKYQDNSGTWHYSTPCFIAKESVNGGVTDIPFTDGGQITNIQLRPDKSLYIFHDISGATKDEFPIYADIRVCRDSKEGGFYDTIGNEYYFSETATPLVYTEL